MQFLLDFVSCCGTPSRHSISTASPQPCAEETRSLVISPPSRADDGGRNRRRKRGSFGARRCGSAAAEWRPSLYAISEDKVVPEKDERTTTAARSERIVKRKVATTARIHVQSHGDEFGQISLPSIIPAFSATPFLF